MNQELEAIRDAVDKSTGDGRDLDKGVALSETYVDANPDQYTDPMFEEAIANRNLDAIVHATEVFRDAGMEEKEWQLVAFDLAKFHRQEIGGTVQPSLREEASPPVPNAAARVRHSATKGKG